MSIEATFLSGPFWFGALSNNFILISSLLMRCRSLIYYVDGNFFEKPVLTLFIILMRKINCDNVIETIQKKLISLIFIDI